MPVSDQIIFDLQPGLRQHGASAGVFPAPALGQHDKSEQAIEAIHFSDTPEQVLVTGGTGFIGQLLVRALVAGGHMVTVLTRDTKKAAWLFDGKARCIGSMGELPATQRIDVIVNLAGARILGWRWSEARKQTLLQSRIGTTDKIVAWIARAEHKPRLLLSGSAIGYYGIQRRGDDTPLTESSPPQAIFMSRLCQEWEAAAGNAAQYGTRVACMRFGLVMGRQGALSMMLLPIRLGLGGPLGGGRQWLSWIHVHDLLRAIAFLWNRDMDEDGGALPQPYAQQAYNFTALESVTQAQFSRSAARVLHRPSFLPAPALPMKLILGEQSDLLLEGQRVAPDKLRAKGFEFRYPTVESALEEIVG